MSTKQAPQVAIADSKPHRLREWDCPYCNSDNQAIRDTYYDQTCKGCVDRMKGA